ncbi:MAG: cysteine desulfurase family protein [Planctomycetota bacterium]
MADAEKTLDLDANATTRLCPEAWQAMQPWLGAEYGNPSSVHDLGRRARKALEAARAQTAAAVNCHPDEVFFFSSATEATNALIQSALHAAGGAAGDERHPAAPPRVLSSPAEHECVLKPLERLAAAQQIALTLIGLDGAGQLEMKALDAALLPHADAAAAAPTAAPAPAPAPAGRWALASFMHANNETGVVTDVGALAGLFGPRGIPFHCDGVQSLGKLPLDFHRLGMDYLTLAPHKCGGPKGVGILVARRTAALEPWIVGGPQEAGIRGGTENVAAIVGAGAALAVAAARQAARAPAWAVLRDRLEAQILAGLPGAQVWGAAAARVANTTFLSVPGIEAEAALMRLSQRGLYAASGAACSSSRPEPSHVLLAMGATQAEARGAIRFSLPPALADLAPADAMRDIRAAADTIVETLRRLHAETPPAATGGTTHAADGNRERTA